MTGPFADQLMVQCNTETTALSLPHFTSEGGFNLVM
jgi:hypothetical protein